MYWGSTKIRETRKEDDDIPSFSASIEHDVPYLPNFRLRYTKLDTPDLAHDKYDYTFYYRPLRTDALEFDVGFTFLIIATASTVSMKTKRVTLIA
ncbi:ABC-type Fe3+-hydroxamate transport system [Vibrio ishigakensis]|uniref:ABC-type Fe3+-hydroxamate transport system n=1 Tax=Vibrio ishigakensis TaxID=1481914 RepID=A0A0B8PI22_9VIBR|nr:ABC-type Fe3+-hydroxamate transport system [Vibrio ishigakensis]